MFLESRGSWSYNSKWHGMCVNVQAPCSFPRSALSDTLALMSLLHHETESAEGRERPPRKAFAPEQYASPGSAAISSAALPLGASTPEAALATGDRGDGKRCAKRMSSTSAEPQLCRLPKPGSGMERCEKNAGVLGTLPAFASLSCSHFIPKRSSNKPSAQPMASRAGSSLQPGPFYGTATFLCTCQKRHGALHQCARNGTLLRVI